MTGILNFPLELEAHKSDNNVHRFREYEVSSEDEAKKFINKVLKKRAGAFKRIGTDYKIVEDQAKKNWLCGMPINKDGLANDSK